MKVMLATGNAHKVREIREMLEGTHFSVLSLHDLDSVPEIIEDRDTFRGNAFKKAMALSKHLGTLAIADDSGIAVDALDGAPGVRSARFAGVDGESADAANNTLLLERMVEIPDDKRTARFVCAMAIVHPDGRTRYVDGIIEGHIAHELCGEGGFGYDPLFLVDGDSEGRTMAQLSPDEKNAISHRGRALRQLLPLLEGLVESH